MGKLGDLLLTVGDTRLAFYCPGCNTFHVVPVGFVEEPSWQFNGDLVHPTFYPAIETTHFVMSAKGKEDYVKWTEAGCPLWEDRMFDGSTVRCHFYVTLGFIEYLADSTHALAGQTVRMLNCDDYRL